MSKKPSRLQQELNRIKRQIKALEKKGYTIEAFELPKTPREARAIKPETIRQNAFKVDTSTNNKIPYHKAKKIEPLKNRIRPLLDDETDDEIRPVSIKFSKNKEKKQRKKKEKKSPKYITGEPRKARSDKGTKRGSRKKKEEEFYPKEEDIIMDNLMVLISKLENADVSWGVGKRGQIRKRNSDEISASESARQSLLDIINNEIREYGQNEVAKRLNARANADELGAIVDTLLHGYADDIRPSYVKLVSFITEGMLSQEALSYWSEIDNALDYNYGEI